MQCPSCTAEVLEGSRFCNSCGAALPVRCRECAHSNAAGSRFCANCGARLTGDGLTTLAAAPKPAPPPPFDAAERRHVTVMFCDLVGSTALSEQLDPEDLRAVIAAYYREVAAEVRRFGGFVARHLRDGVLVYFGYPAAREDDAERAVPPRPPEQCREAAAALSANAGLPALLCDANPPRQIRSKVPVSVSQAISRRHCVAYQIQRFPNRDLRDGRRYLDPPDRAHLHDAGS